MKNTFLLLPALFLILGCSNAQQRNSGHIAERQAMQDSTPATSQVALPDSAEAFIQLHFASGTVQHVSEKRSPKPDGTFYEVALTDETEIDFGNDGNWIEVHAKEPNQLPTTFFPEPIQTYLETNFASIGVESIDKDTTGYELELTNDINLYFDANGSFIRQEK